jgi:hypothetical protein
MLEEINKKEKFTLKVDGAWNKFFESSNGTEVLNFVGQRLKIYSWLCTGLTHKNP